MTLSLLTVFLLVTLGRLLNAYRLGTFAIDVRIYRAAAEAAVTGATHGRPAPMASRSADRRRRSSHICRPR